MEAAKEAFRIPFAEHSKRKGRLSPGKAGCPPDGTLTGESSLKRPPIIFNGGTRGPRILARSPPPSRILITRDLESLQNDGGKRH